MGKKKASGSQKLAGKSFVLADGLEVWSPEAATQCIELHGGTVAANLTPEVDSVVVAKADEGPVTAAETEALALNAKGANIQILSEWEFQQLVGPTVAEVLEMIRRGKSGAVRLEEWCGLLPFVVVSDLTGNDLREGSLSHLDRLIIDRCDFRGRKFSDVPLGDCEGANFENARLSGVQLGNADGCNFRGASFKYSFIQSAAGATFDDATGNVCIRQFPRGSAKGMKGELSLGSVETPADATEADFSGGEFKPFHIQRANAAGARFVGTQLLMANLRGANFEAADFTDADLSKAKAGRCNFRKAKLVRSKLEKADLGGADFREADLTGANLKGANLEGADFRGAILTDADLNGAQTDGAKFDG